LLLELEAGLTIDPTQHNAFLEEIERLRTSVKAASFGARDE
jgi:hypothetical protein